MARALMLTAALTGGITMAGSFYNEAHATGTCDLCVIKVNGATAFSCMAKFGSSCSYAAGQVTVSCNSAVKC